MLIICSECGKEYSDQAKTCPHCGAITSKNRYISNNIRDSYSRNNNNNSFLSFVLGIIIFILTFFILSNSFDGILNFFNNINLSSSENRNTSIYNKVYNIGDKIITSKFEITVTNAEQRSKIGSRFFYKTAGDGNVFICVRLKIKNISNKPIGMFSQPSFTLVDGNDSTYYTDVGSSTYYASEIDDTSKAISDLNPGVTIYDSGVFQLGKTYYARNSFSLKINADNVVKVKIK